jgi:hypothetical protein
MTIDAQTQSVRYRVMVTKKEERVLGPAAEDAAADITAPLAVVGVDGFDAAVAFMQGQLSATGHIGTVLEVLATGQATQALLSLASPT